MDEACGTYGRQERYIQNFDGEIEEKMPLGRSTHRWEDRNSVVVLVNWIHVGQDGFYWHSLLHAVVQVRFP